MAIVLNGKEVTADEEKAADQGMVLYSDGGARPNPGFAGWGLHGYLYENVVPKKGSGNPTQLPTAKGYIPKGTADKSQEVKMISYFDGFGSLMPGSTNNMGEMYGALHAMRHAAQFDIKKLNVYTDSKYVIGGVEQYMHKWKMNGWKKGDGSEPSNLDDWKNLDAAYSALKDRGVEVKFNWIKGHNDNFGNEKADVYATMGVMLSKATKTTRSEVTTTASDGYWKYDTDRHPMVAASRVYFNSLGDYIRPGHYDLGEHGKDDDLLGTRTTDGAYSVVRLQKPEEIIEFYRNLASELAGPENDTIFMGRMDRIYNSEVHRLVTTHGRLALNATTLPRVTICSLIPEEVKDEDEESGKREDVLVKELRPARIAVRAVEALGDIEGRLDDYLQHSPLITTTDLTPILYETEVKKGKKGEEDKSIFKLKADYNVGFAALNVDANYQDEKGETVTAPITLTLGIDLLNRNSLKRLEETVDKVTLITWKEAPSVFRFATVIEASGDIGIWAGCYSNYRYITERDLLTKAKV